MASLPGYGQCVPVSVIVYSFSNDNRSKDISSLQSHTHGEEGGREGGKERDAQLHAGFLDLFIRKAQHH